MLLVDDVRNTGQTLARCAELVREGGGTSSRPPRSTTAWKRCVDLGVPNIALAEYKAPDNYAGRRLPAVQAGVPVTTF